MRDTPINPWYMPPKAEGVRQKYVAAYRNTKLHQALVELGKAETRRLLEAKDKGLYDGKTTVSPETIIFNMVLRPSTFTRTMSVRLLERYKQLEKEERDEKKYMDIKGVN